MDFSFDFSTICQQGAYFSSFTATSLQDYLEKPEIPLASSYHCVGCSPSLIPILAKMQVLHVVRTYKELFAKRKTVIDLLLPYYSSSHCKSYLGRYIIFRGQLLGIRISTGKGSFFHSWPRGIVKNLVQTDSQSQTNLLIGQFGLNLANLRIGLLFDNEIMSLANEYVNCCFDVLVIMRESHQSDSQMQAKIKELVLRVVVIQVIDKQKREYLQLQHLQDLCQGSIHFAQKSKINIGYYSFDKMYANKQQLQLNKTVLPSLEIDFQPCQPQGKFDSQSPFFPHHMMEGRIQDASRLPKVHQLYLSRLLSLFSFNAETKIILVVQQSPGFLCILYMLRLLFHQCQCGIQNCLKDMFHMVGSVGQQFHSFLLRSQVIAPQHVEKVMEQEQSFYQCAWLKKLHELAKKTNQEWISILATNSKIHGVVQLLNKRLDMQKNNQNELNFLKTYLIYHFFSYEELVNIYFSEQFRQFIGNDEYISKLWTKHPFHPNFQENCLVDQSLSSHPNNPIMSSIQYEFEKWLSGFESSLQRDQLFSHFWFRSIGIVRPTYTALKQQFSINFHQQLLSIPKTSLIRIISFLRPVPSTAGGFQPTIKPNQPLKLYPQTVRNACHSCSKKLERSQLFGCSLLNCLQQFCLKCLTLNFSYQAEYLLRILGMVKGKAANLNVCPACQSLCPPSCLVCRKTRQVSQTPKVQKSQICHFCESTKSQSVKKCNNVQCQAVFCECCLLRSELKSAEAYLSQSGCYVCQRKCNCSNCQKKVKTNFMPKPRPFALGTRNVNPKYGNTQSYNESRKKQQSSCYFQFKNRPSSSQNYHHPQPHPKIPLKNDSKSQQNTESLEICFEPSEVDQQSCPTSKTVKICGKGKQMSLLYA